MFLSAALHVAVALKKTWQSSTCLKGPRNFNGYGYFYVVRGGRDSASRADIVENFALGTSKR